MQLIDDFDHRQYVRDMVDLSAIVILVLVTHSLKPHQRRRRHLHPTTMTCNPLHPEGMELAELIPFLPPPPASAA
jgi:hypothetical protein